MTETSRASPPPRGNNGGIVVFGGGTATNSLVDVFERIRGQRGCSLSYVIPISDNGGSSSELIRVFGGPGIGDVRSRLVRLIPGSDTDPEQRALRELFNHRLPSDRERARVEWLDVVEGRDRVLWRDVSSEKRELVRSVLNLANLEIVKRARPSSTFNFAKASIGNLFLTGARVFTGSLESGIYLLSSICSIPSTVSALPVINSNFTHHISAGLADGTVITGQNAISHPSAPTSLPASGVAAASDPDQDAEGRLLLPALTDTASGTMTPLETETAAHDLIEDATLPGSLPSLRKPYIEFSKGGGGGGGGATKNAGGEAGKDEHDDDDDDLPARIDRIWYINPYGHEIRPVPNPKVLAAIRGAGAVVYSIGSLYTSLMPSLILRGVGDAIAGVHNNGNVGNGNANGSGGPKHKVLILNSSIDRETGPSGNPYTAADFVRAIVRGAGSQGVQGPVKGPVAADSLVYSSNKNTTSSLSNSNTTSETTSTAPDSNPTNPTTSTPSTTVTATAPAIQNDQKMPGSASGSGLWPPPASQLQTWSAEAEQVRRYVTHLIYLDGEGAPRVDREELGRLGVECIRVYGRRVDGTLRYDEAGLTRALEAIMGRPDNMGRNRRNTSGQ
ncbi:hypothetical protein DL764_009384 [Monosporascus ibericus]|uniref:Uncharacterized protein n=1 Tax=Monosporascus ibericus TaxID=155417 RepID=A0A4Q4SY72_9PEZI|nr:hypothetical protein DL764_009384 [Monosporascus ibericus]